MSPPSRLALASLALAALASGCARPPPAPARPAASPPPAVAAADAAVADASPSPDPPVARLPEPPRQRAPWSPPPEASLSPAQRAAVAFAFEHLVADPRDCEYRAVTLRLGSVWSGDGGTADVHGWVLPGDGRPHAIAWNGLVYPVERVGEPADLAADVAAVAHPRSDAGAHPFARAQEASSVAPDPPTRTAALLLLRLGDASLARDLAVPAGDPAAALVALAQDPAWWLFERGLTAHMRGDDALAGASFEKLAAASAALDAAVAALRTGADAGDAPALDFVRQLPALVADQRRRARAPRPPLDLAALPSVTDPARRVAALVDALDQVAARQMGQPGGVDLGESPIVQALVREGEAAVEPLLDVLERDARLTRSVHFWRDFARHRTALGVHEAAYVALAGILQVTAFEPASTGDSLSARGGTGQREVAARVRAYWSRWRAVPIEERWLRTLQDDAATPERWVEAAQNLTRPTNVTVSRGSMAFTTTTTTTAPDGGPPPLAGESLRGRRGPSVTELLGRRAAALAASDDHRGHACTLAIALGAWDARGGLDALRQVSARVRARSGDAEFEGRCLSRLALLRVEAGDAAALDEYGPWLARVAPAQLSWGLTAAVEPLWRHPAHPAMERAATALFERPGSPWVPFVGPPGFARPYDLGRLLESPEPLRSPPLRRHVVRALRDRERVGTLRMRDEGSFELETSAGATTTGARSPDPAMPRAGATLPVRRCDWYAWQLSRWEGAPAFEPWWPVARRDAALPGFVELTRRGVELAARPLPSVRRLLLRRPQPLRRTTPCCTLAGSSPWRPPVVWSWWWHRCSPRVAIPRPPRRRAPTARRWAS